MLLPTLLLLHLLERPLALVGATLRGLHPMPVQAGPNVTARSDVLAGAFVLGTLVVVARWTRTGHWPWLFASVVPAVLAMGSRESVLLLPFAAGAVVTVLGGTLRRSLLAATALRRLPSRYGVVAGASLAAAFGLATTQMTPAGAPAEAYRSSAADDVLSSPPRNRGEAHLSHLTRARRFRDGMRNDEALRELLAADRIATRLPEHRWQLADVLLGLGRPKEAVAVLEQSLSPEFRFDPAGDAQPD